MSHTRLLVLKIKMPPIENQNGNKLQRKRLGCFLLLTLGQYPYFMRPNIIIHETTNLWKFDRNSDKLHHCFHYFQTSNFKHAKLKIIILLNFQKSWCFRNKQKSRENIHHDYNLYSHVSYVQIWDCIVNFVNVAHALNRMFLPSWNHFTNQRK